MHESPSETGTSMAGSPTQDAGAECTAESGTTSIETKFTALALLWGKPPMSWIMLRGSDNRGQSAVPLSFRMALERLFDPVEVARVGLARFAIDYAMWYYQDSIVVREMASGIVEIFKREDHKRSST